MRAARDLGHIRLLDTAQAGKAKWHREFARTPRHSASVEVRPPLLLTSHRRRPSCSGEGESHPGGGSSGGPEPGIAGLGQQHLWQRVSPRASLSGYAVLSRRTPRPEQGTVLILVPLPKIETRSRVQKPRPRTTRKVQILVF